MVFQIPSACNADADNYHAAAQVLNVCLVFLDLVSHKLLHNDQLCLSAPMSPAMGGLPLCSLAISIANTNTASTPCLLVEK